jgi:hypothetical protein
MFNWIKTLFTTEPKVKEKAVAYKIEPTITESTKKKNKIKEIVVKPSFKTKKDLAKMTKVKLEQIGRVHGIELDRRLTKDKLVTQLWKHIKK